MVDEIDADGNGEIDFDEFVTVMSRKVNTSYTPAQVKAAFKVFERDCPNGFVSMAALEQALTTYGSEKLSLSDAQELLSQIEPDENGQINYVEFVNMMCAHAFARPPARTPHASSPLMPPVRVTSWQDRFMIATQPYRVRWPATRAWWLVCVCVVCGGVCRMCGV